MSDTSINYIFVISVGGGIVGARSEIAMHAKVHHARDRLFNVDFLLQVIAQMKHPMSQCSTFS